jgi:hypothetical protein
VDHGEVATRVLPDASICDDCIDDITDKNNRRYGYPFTNCTHCGPRFSIIKKNDNLLTINLHSLLNFIGNKSSTPFLSNFKKV